MQQQPSQRLPRDNYDPIPAETMLSLFEQVYEQPTQVYEQLHTYAYNELRQPILPNQTVLTAAHDEQATVSHNTSTTEQHSDGGNGTATADCNFVTHFVNTSSTESTIAELTTDNITLHNTDQQLPIQQLSTETADYEHTIPDDNSSTSKLPALTASVSSSSSTRRLDEQ